MTPTLARIRIYPIKSLDPLELTTARLLPSGALQGDRRFALVDAQCKFISAKRTARLCQIRARFEGDLHRVDLETPSASAHFELRAGNPELEAFVSDFLGMPATLIENTAVGFPDDLDAPGPTVISTATLHEIARWFNLDLADTRLRFRANLEIDGVPAFWEDRLYAKPGEPVPFRIGSAVLEGTNPCQRCAVPARDPRTGESIGDFAKRFGALREQTLPTWAERSRFNHFYRLAINTRVPTTGQRMTLNVGDAVVVPT